MNKKQLLVKALIILDDDLEMGGEMTNAFNMGQVNSTMLSEELAEVIGDPDCVEDDSTDNYWLVNDVAVDAGLQFEDEHGIPH